jgi:peptide-methionine (R)-S-oxide reductase
MNRRTLLAGGAGVLALTAWLRLRGDAPAVAAPGTPFPVTKTDAEWHATLTGQQYGVLRGHGTEPPGSSPLDHETRAGVFACAGCDQAAYRSQDKFDSGTGWPSFTRPIEGAVATSEDKSWLGTRTEVHCSQCGGHLGHVFPDGPQPTGRRYCMNGVALNFRPA